MPHNLALSYLVVALIGYGLGSIPFGLLLTSWSGGGDIRSIGSGNIGATNVLRTGRKSIAAATLFFDASKGGIAILLAALYADYFVPRLGLGKLSDQKPLLMAIAGCAATMGHCFPVWLKFRGGKGVATGLGVLWVLFWPVGFVCTLIWIAGVKFSKISSIGALLAFFCAPILAPALSGQPALSPFPIAIDLISLLIWLRHYSNLMRLLNGTEPRSLPQKKS